MANKGENKTLKRLVSPQSRQINRKEAVFAIRTSPGPHSDDKSIPLGGFLRDLIKVAGNLREAKFILNSMKVKVNGKVRTEYKFPVGLFDFIELLEEKSKKYRLVFDSKGRFMAVELDPKSKNLKISKVTGKRIIKKGLIQLNTDDGRSFVEKKTDLNIGDSLKIELPNQKIVSSLPLEKDVLVYLISGKHVGATAKVKGMTKGKGKAKTLLNLQEGKDEFQTVSDNVMVIGKDKPEVELGAEK